MQNWYKPIAKKELKETIIYIFPTSRKYTQSFPSENIYEGSHYVIQSSRYTEMLPFYQLNQELGFTNFVSL